MVNRPFQKTIKHLNFLFRKFDKECLKRRRKVTFEVLFHHKFLQITKHLGVIPANHLFRRISKIDVSPQAIHQFNDKVPLRYLQKINMDILKDRFAGKNNRIFAVDGTRLSLNRKIAILNSSYKLTPKEGYTDALLTTIFEVNQKTPFRWNLTPHHNERRGFLDLLPSLKRGDTVIFDRGYYSEQLLKELDARKVKFIFRLKSNSLIARLPGTDIPVPRPKTTPLRKVSYSLKGTTFTLLTNLGVQWDVRQLADLYHSRWQIEEWYNFVDQIFNL